MRRKGVQDSDPFDWERLPSEHSLTNSGATTNAAIKESKIPARCD